MPWQLVFNGNSLIVHKDGVAKTRGAYWGGEKEKRRVQPPALSAYKPMLFTSVFFCHSNSSG